MMTRFSPRRAALVAPLALSLTLLAACGDSNPVDVDPADSVASVRLTLTNTMATVVTIAEGGAVTGGPVVLPAGATTVAVSFLNAEGQLVGGLDEFELRLVPANAALVSFTRTGPFTGRLTRLAAGTTTLDVQLYHVLEGHADRNWSLPVTM